jgi:hypothetical protein
MQHRAPQQEHRSVFAHRGRVVSICFGEDIDVR